MAVHEISVNQDANKTNIEGHIYDVDKGLSFYTEREGKVILKDPQDG